MPVHGQGRSYLDTGASQLYSTDTLHVSGSGHSYLVYIHCTASFSGIIIHGPCMHAAVSYSFQALGPPHLFLLQELRTALGIPTAVAVSVLHHPCQINCVSKTLPRKASTTRLRMCQRTAAPSSHENSSIHLYYIQHPIFHAPSTSMQALLSNRHEPPSRRRLHPLDMNIRRNLLGVLRAARIPESIPALFGQRVIEVREGVTLPQHRRTFTL